MLHYTSTCIDVYIYDACSPTMHDVAISECKQRWRLTKVMHDRVRVNKFSTKHVLEQKKKGRAQQLQYTRTNRKFSVAKQQDKAEMQPCVATADDELGVERCNTRLADFNVVELCLSCGLSVCHCLIISWLFLRLTNLVNEFDEIGHIMYITCPRVT